MKGNNLLIYQHECNISSTHLSDFPAHFHVLVLINNLLLEHHHHINNLLEQYLTSFGSENDFLEPELLLFFILSTKIIPLK